MLSLLSVLPVDCLKNVKHFPATLVAPATFAGANVGAKVFLAGSYFLLYFLYKKLHVCIGKVMSKMADFVQIFLVYQILHKFFMSQSILFVYQNLFWDFIFLLLCLFQDIIRFTPHGLSCYRCINVFACLYNVCL